MSRFMSNERGSDRINVLIALDKPSYNGRIHGGGRSFFNLVSGIDRRRFKVVACILRREDALKELFEREGLEVRYLGRGKFSPLVLIDLLQLIRTERVQVLHLNSFCSQQFGRIAGMIAGIPAIVHARGLTDYPRVWYQRVSDRLLSRFTARTLAVSREAGDAYIMNRAVAPDNVVVLPNGVSLEQFTPLDRKEYLAVKRDLDIDEGQLVVGVVSRLRDEKGIKHIIEAAARVLSLCKNATFLIVGDGPLLDELKMRVTCLGIEKSVIFTGFRENVRELLSIFDVKVFTSLGEGCSNVLLEAMAMGRAIVAPNVSGVNEVLSDGLSGLLCPVGDTEAMAARIIHLLKNERERGELGRGARLACEPYSLKKVVSRLQAIYEEVASGPAKRARNWAEGNGQDQPPQEVI